jgi:predicted nuclease with TOPRIM domain
MSKNVNEIIDRVRELDTETADADQQIARLEGKKEQIFSSLDDDFKVKTVPQATKKVGELTKRLEQVDGKIVKEYESLTEEFDF